MISGLWVLGFTLCIVSNFQHNEQDFLLKAWSLTRVDHYTMSLACPKRCSIHRDFDTWLRIHSSYEWSPPCWIPVLREGEKRREIERRESDDYQSEKKVLFYNDYFYNKVLKISSYLRVSACLFSPHYSMFVIWNIIKGVYGLNWIKFYHLF